MCIQRLLRTAFPVQQALLAPYPTSLSQQPRAEPNADLRKTPVDQNSSRRSTRTTSARAAIPDTSSRIPDIVETGRGEHVAADGRGQPRGAGGPNEQQNITRARGWPRAPVHRAVRDWPPRSLVQRSHLPAVLEKCRGRQPLRTALPARGRTFGRRRRGRKADDYARFPGASQSASIA
ncbi:hypothetical protein FKP32DRAFT_761698 [Trametes sanguinea]|nr:hypothetical protein FKP32DRAFT_761698 [Trametes sanguinea]